MEQLKSLTECMWLLERSVISMTRKEFESKSFEEVMEQLNEECDDVTTIDILKDFIKRKVDSEDFYLVAHLCDAIWNDPDSSNSDWYLYDYSMGTLDTPICVSKKEHIEHLIYD